MNINESISCVDNDFYRIHFKIKIIKILMFCYFGFDFFAQQFTLHHN